MQAKALESFAHYGKSVVWSERKMLSQRRALRWNHIVDDQLI